MTEICLLIWSPLDKWCALSQTEGFSNRGSHSFCGVGPILSVADYSSRHGLKINRMYFSSGSRNTICNLSNIGRKFNHHGKDKLAGRKWLMIIRHAVCYYYPQYPHDNIEKKKWKPTFPRGGPPNPSWKVRAESELPLIAEQEITSVEHPPWGSPSLKNNGMCWKESWQQIKQS